MSCKEFIPWWSQHHYLALLKDETPIVKDRKMQIWDMIAYLRMGETPHFWIPLSADFAWCMSLSNRNSILHLDLIFIIHNVIKISYIEVQVVVLSIKLSSLISHCTV